MSITCQQCGETNADAASMCGMCGALLKKMTAPPPSPAMQTPPPAARTAIPPSPPPMPNMPRTGYSMQPVEYAGFWLRVVASIIDLLVTGTIGAIISAIMGFMMGAAGVDPATIQVFGFIVCTILGWLYAALLESSPVQATLGKMALGLKVTDLEGQRISFGRATGRHFAMYLSSIILGIGLIMAGFTEKKQALHDMMAGTLVVRK